MFGGPVSARAAGSRARPARRSRPRRRPAQRIRDRGRRASASPRQEARRGATSPSGGPSSEHGGQHGNGGADAERRASRHADADGEDWLGRDRSIARTIATISAVPPTSTARPASSAAVAAGGAASRLRPATPPPGIGAPSSARSPVPSARPAIVASVTATGPTEQRAEQRHLAEAGQHGDGADDRDGGAATGRAARSRPGTGSRPRSARPCRAVAIASSLMARSMAGWPVMPAVISPRDAPSTMRSICGWTVSTMSFSERATDATIIAASGRGRSDAPAAPVLHADITRVSGRSERSATSFGPWISSSSGGPSRRIGTSVLGPNSSSAIALRATTACPG